MYGTIMNPRAREPHKELSILEQAVEAVETGTGIHIQVAGAPNRDFEGYPDAILHIDGEEYFAEIKAWAQHIPLGTLITQLWRYPKGILVADYVNLKMAARLRQAGIEFIDTAGNAFIKTPAFHIQVMGNRKPHPAAEGAGPRKLRGFTAAGLRVTYQFLCKPELATAPYREIALEAGVALGTVGNVIDDLVAAGFLFVREDERRLVNRDAMLDTWVERYPAALRPKLHLGVFKTQSMDWWKEFPISDFDAYWGGEIAAAHYTGYLRPAVATIYVPREHHAKLIAKARLTKMTHPNFEPGAVELLKPFWSADGAKDWRPYVHPVLAYADLIATGDPRNLEVARKLYEKRITQYLR
jgi:hypothetical protein